VPEAHEGAIEQYLRDGIGITSSWRLSIIARAPAFRCCGMKWRTRNVLRGFTKNMKVEDYEPIISVSMEDGVISRMDKLVEFRDPLGARRAVLAELRAAYLTESVTPRNGGERACAVCLRDSGWTCYQGRMVTGGRPDEAGPLGMEARIAGSRCGGDATRSADGRNASKMERIAASLKERKRASMA